MKAVSSSGWLRLLLVLAFWLVLVRFGRERVTRVPGLSGTFVNLPKYFRFFGKK
jgi:hypothetical protein